MGKGRSPWQDGRRAWQRLNGWHQDAPTATPGHPDDGDEALTALADIGRVRHLLDQAELVAVRTARRHAKSWAEIATKLGVTRQSAWERWRDLDGTDGAEGADGVGGIAAPEAGDAGAGAGPAGAATSPGPVEIALASAAADVADRAARERRRQSSIVVPNVVGMTWADARQALRDASLVGVGPDPDAPPLAAALTLPDAVVVDQSPESGAKVPAGSLVRLWLEGGGGSAGVREPRRPKPAPRAARAMRFEPTEDPADEAVG
jgi:hypothetical protein